MERLAKLVTVQLFAKVFQIVLSFMTTRLVSKQVFGYANANLGLTTTCCMFWWRECIRKVIQKNVGKDCEALIYKWLVIQICFALLTLTQVFIWEEQVEHQNISILFTVVASVIEAPTEIFYFKSIEQPNARLAAEGIALFLKSIFTYCFLVYDYGLIAYSGSLLVYSSTLIIVYKLTLKPVPKSTI